MGLNSLLKARHSTRKFKNKKPDWRDIIECINAARFSPMAGDNYTLKFILISDKEKIQKLAKTAQQDFIAQAHYIVVACSTPKRTLNAYGERGKMYLHQQAGAAIENFLLKITEKKLATCWIGHFTEPHVKQILKIPDDVQVEAIFPIGFEEKKPKKKAKIDLDNILYFEEYSRKKMKIPKKLEV